MMKSKKRIVALFVATLSLLTLGAAGFAQKHFLILGARPVVTMQLSGAVERASRHAVYLSLHQLIGRGTQENGIGVRQLLQYCGQSGCRPQGSVELLRGIWESPHHERPGMEPQTDEDTLAAGLRAEGCLLLQVLAQLHRCQHRPSRMVFVRHRGPKQPHKPLPAHLHRAGGPLPALLRGRPGHG